MVKLLIVLAVIGSLLVFGTNRGLHRSHLQGAQTDAILSRWAADRKVDLIREYATLPAYDRALIEKRCGPVYVRYEKNLGTTDTFRADDNPGCQALIRGGWQPGWTIDSGLRFMESGIEIR